MANPFDEYKAAHQAQIDQYAALPNKVKRMHKAWGANPSQTCSTCKFYHLTTPASCQLGTDIRYGWQGRWMACGQHALQASGKAQDENNGEGHTK